MIYDIIVLIVCINVLILYYTSIQYKSVQTISLSCNDNADAYCEYFSARATCLREQNKHISTVINVKIVIYIMFIILTFLIFLYLYDDERIQKIKDYVFGTDDIRKVLQKLKQRSSDNEQSLFVITYIISLLVIITFNIENKDIGTINSDYQEARKSFTEYMRQNDDKDTASQSPDYSRLREEIETNIKFVHNVKNPSYFYAVAKENDNLLDYIYTNTEKRRAEKRPSLFYLKYDVEETKNREVIPNHLRYLFDDINVDFKNKNVNYDLFMHYNQKIFGTHILNEIYAIDLIMIFIILAIHIFLMDFDYISLVSMCVFMFLILAYIMIFNRK